MRSFPCYLILLMPLLISEAMADCGTTLSALADDSQLETPLENVVEDDGIKK